MEEFIIEGSDLVKYFGKGGEVNVPEGVEKIASAFAGMDKAFYKYESVSCVALPKSLKVIGAQAFEGCKNLKTVKYAGTLEEWCAVEIHTNANPLLNGADFYCGGELVEDLVIPEGVEIINSFQFAGGNFKSVDVPASVKEIWFSAFQNCRRLEKINFAEGLKEIRSGAFSYCDNLESIVLPNGVERLESCCFGHGKRLKSAFIPASVTVADMYLFYNSPKDFVVNCGAKRRPRYWNRRWNVCGEDSGKRFFSVKRRVKVKWDVKF